MINEIQLVEEPRKTLSMNPKKFMLWLFIATGYVFKFAAALLDTPFVHLAVRFLGPYLRINPTMEHVADVEETQLPDG